jgi:hypothetical protein
VVVDSNFPRGPFGVSELRRALDKVVDALPPHKRGPSIRACLAQQLVSLASAHRTNSISELSELSLREVAAKCADCHGCDGLPDLRRQNISRLYDELLRATSDPQREQIKAHITDELNKFHSAPSSR